MACRNEKRPERGVFAEVLAEAVRFELTDPCESTVFKTVAIDHSATLPSMASIVTALAGSTGVQHAPFFDEGHHLGQAV